MHRPGIFSFADVSSLRRSPLPYQRTAEWEQTLTQLHSSTWTLVLNRTDPVIGKLTAFTLILQWPHPGPYKSIARLPTWPYRVLHSWTAIDLHNGPRTPGYCQDPRLSTRTPTHLLVLTHSTWMIQLFGHVARARGRAHTHTHMAKLNLSTTA